METRNLMSLEEQLDYNFIPKKNIFSFFYLK